MSLKLRLFVKMLTFCLVVFQANGRPVQRFSDGYSTDVIKKLKSIFKFGQGIMVYNVDTAREALEDDEIVCAERRAGKSYCKEIENYMEATRLDKIDPEQFARFREYFNEYLEQPQIVATRMDFGNSPCNRETNLIYPEGALSEDAQWLFVVQHEQYKQGVLVEECENEVRPGEENSTLPLEEISITKQNFSYRKMVVLVNGEMTVKTLKLPSNCECRM